MSLYTYGASKPARRPAQDMTADEVRAEAKRIRAIARETRNLANAKIQWLNAQDDLILAREHLATWQERMDAAEHIRQAATERYGYTPEECRTRLLAAADEMQGSKGRHAPHTTKPDH